MEGGTDEGSDGSIRDVVFTERAFRDIRGGCIVD